MDDSKQENCSNEESNPQLHEGQDNTSLIKHVTLLYAFSLTFGSIVGSGIFITVKDTFSVFESNPLGIVLIFWFLAGILSLCGGLCYAELGTRFPQSGGERVYYREILSPKISTLFCIFYVFLIKPLTLAALVVTSGKYTVRLWSTREQFLLEKGFAILFLLFCFINNAISKELAMKASLVLTIFKTIALLIIIGCGIDSMIQKKGRIWTNMFKVRGFRLQNFGKSLISLFWSFECWNTVGLVAGDMKNPKKDLPTAICSGILLVTILYLLAILSYAAVLGFETARFTTTIAYSLAVSKLKRGAFVITILICLSATGAANGILFATSWVAASAGHCGEFPKIFSLVHRGSRTPIFSLFVITIITTGFLFIDFNTTLAFCEYLNWMFYFLSFSCLWIVKIESHGQYLLDVFQVPYLVIVPIQLVCIVVVLLSFYNYPIGCTGFFIALLGVLGIQFLLEKGFSIPFSSEAHERFIDILSNFFGQELALDEDIQ